MYTRKYFWSKSQIDIKSRQEILSNFDIVSTNDNPTEQLNDSGYIMEYYPKLTFQINSCL